MIRASGLGGTLLGVAAGLSLANAASAAGDVERGAQVFRACVACHSFAPARHLTGPSLAGVWDRKAGTAEGFGRYSPELKRSGIVWDSKNLDAWLKSPSALVPGDGLRRHPGRSRPQRFAGLSRGSIESPGGGARSRSTEPQARRRCGAGHRFATAATFISKV